MDVNTELTVRIALQAMRCLDLDPARELSAIGVLDPGGDVEARTLPRSAYRRLWARLIEASDDPAFGVALAQQLPGGSLGLPEWAAISAPTVGEGLAALAELGALLHTGGWHALEVDGDVARFTYSSTDPADTRGVLDWSFAYLVRRLREIASEEVSVREVHLRYPRPDDVGPLRQAFGCELRFDAAKTALVLDRGSLDVPLTTDHPETHRALMAVASRALRASGQSIEARVLGALAQKLEAGELPTLGAVAKSLATSERSLQRALAAHGTSFRALVHRARMEQAERWLRDSRRSVTAVALELGYSDTSAFCRAYRRHFGETPVAHRECG